MAMDNALRDLVLASNNAKKLAELGDLFAPLGLRLLPQGALAVPEPDEPYATFIENALHKARHASRLAGLPALADDSGLCVDALGGAPGVWSARYAPLADTDADGARESRRARQDAANNAHLLAALAGQTAPQQRRARFVCTLVAVRHPDDPEPLVATGDWPGRIALQPAGDGGFGYDPLMWLDEPGCSVAQLSAVDKQRLGHRGVAGRALLALMRARWALGDAGA
ncbi:non-canonical purine NTP pyrophosphatase [Amphibiibacter pelophylacis]|uniref:Non-canonical purine NTP pyrophosphatase n=1 Tax=Amphibiibacter pelophylacis TaxID=1799477 RepID=A0ACC6P037_9BURK